MRRKSPKSSHDRGAALAVFDDDAVVHDEGGEHRGTNAIRAWMDDVRGKYGALHVEVVDVVANAADTVVTSIVSGNFKGSPARLRYRFVLDGTKIARLDLS